MTWLSVSQTLSSFLFIHLSSLTPSLLLPSLPPSFWNGRVGGEPEPVSLHHAGGLQQPRAAWSLHRTQGLPHLSVSYHHPHMCSQFPHFALGGCGFITYRPNLLQTNSSQYQGALEIMSTLGKKCDWGVLGEASLFLLWIALVTRHCPPSKCQAGCTWCLASSFWVRGSARVLASLS